MPSPSDLFEQLAALPSDWHGSGCLPMENLEAIARHAGARRIQRSVETGAGKSTLLLSHISDHHTVFAVDGGESLTRARKSPLLRSGHVMFVEGPTQITLLGHDFRDPLQLVLIDGPHGFPFPDLEYWKLYPHLDRGGLLVLDDIHIPTIRRLFDVLAEDEMFTLLETVGNTAFFERTDAPTFSPTGDGWWLQRYNAARFPVPYEGRLTGSAKRSAAEVYRERLVPLVEGWKRGETRVAIFGTGEHTARLLEMVPELSDVRIVAYLDSSATGNARYGGLPVKTPSWAPGQVDVVLCSSFAHELTQLTMLDELPVKVVLSHPPSYTMPVEREAAAA